MFKIIYVSFIVSFLYSNELELFLISSSKTIQTDEIKQVDKINKIEFKDPEHKLNAMMREMKESIQSVEKDISYGIKSIIPIKDLKIKTKIKHDKVQSQFIYPILVDE